MPPLTLSTAVPALAALADYSHTALSIAIAILGIGFLIFVHELGHFLACRLTRTRVETFSIGFGPRLFGWERHQGRRLFTVGRRRFLASEGAMDVRIAAVPLGGYVKMAGEIGGDGTPGGPDGERPPPKPDEFPAKSFLARVFIISAGVLMNVATAIVFYTVAFTGGVQETAPVVGAVSEGGPAWAAGLRPGDRILSYGGEPVRSFEDLFQAVIHHERGVPADVVVRRANAERTLTVVPDYDADAGFQQTRILTPLTATIDDGASEPFPIGAEDRVRIEDRTVVGAMSAVRLLQDHASAGRAQVSLSFPDRPEPARTVSLARLRRVPEKDRTYRIGVALQAPLTVEKVRRGSAPDAAGLRPGDRVVRVRDAAGGPERPVALRRDLSASKGLEAVVVTRGVPAVETVLPLVARDADAVAEVWDAVAFEGPTKKGDSFVPVVVPDGAAFPDGESPAAAAGMRPGDRILGIAKAPVETWDEALARLKDLSEKPVTLTVQSGTEPSRDVEVVPKAVFDPKGAEEFHRLEQATATVRAPNVAAAAGMAVGQTVTEVRKIFTMIRQFITGGISPNKALSGPGTIVNISSRKTSEGIAGFLGFLALISVNLAVLNVLPIPVLDGGHLLFLLIEKVRGGKPLKEATIAKFQLVGFVLLLALMVIAVKNDVLNLGR
jgi:regulator of sigma E protease